MSTPPPVDRLDRPFDHHLCRGQHDLARRRGSRPAHRLPVLIRDGNYRNILRHARDHPAQEAVRGRPHDRGARHRRRTFRPAGGSGRVRGGYASGGPSRAAPEYRTSGCCRSDEIVSRLESIVDVVDIPVIADADTGYGNALNARGPCAPSSVPASPRSIWRTRRFPRTAATTTTSRWCRWRRWSRS